MVKHQRRSHQRGIHSVEMEDGDTSESESGDSPSTPRHPSLHWPQGLHAGRPAISRAQSYSDFSNHLDYSSAAYNQRHSVSGTAQDYRSTNIIEAQYEAPPALQRVETTPHNAFYVPDQNNPGVATMNVSSLASVPRYQIPVNVQERQASYPVQALPASVHTSPALYPTQVRNAVPAEIYYTHQQPPPVQQYTQTTTPEQHTQQLLPQQPNAISTQQPIILTIPQVSHVQPQYTSPEQQWYSGQFSEPVEVISLANSYTSAGIYDPWGAKLEAFDDPSMQLPSARIATL